MQSTRELTHAEPYYKTKFVKQIKTLDWTGILASGILPDGVTLGNFAQDLIPMPDSFLSVQELINQ